MVDFHRPGHKYMFNIINFPVTVGYQGKPGAVLLQFARNGAMENSYSQPPHMESKVLQRFGNKHIKGSQRIFQ